MCFSVSGRGAALCTWFNLQISQQNVNFHKKKKNTHNCLIYECVYLCLEGVQLCDPGSICKFDSKSSIFKKKKKTHNLFNKYVPQWATNGPKGLLNFQNLLSQMDSATFKLTRNTHNCIIYDMCLSLFGMAAASCFWFNVQNAHANC